MLLRRTWNHPTFCSGLYSVPCLSRFLALFTRLVHTGPSPSSVSACPVTGNQQEEQDEDDEEYNGPACVPTKDSVHTVHLLLFDITVHSMCTRNEQARHSSKSAPSRDTCHVPGFRYEKERLRDDSRNGTLGGENLTTDTKTLTGFARRTMRDKFIQA